MNMSFSSKAALAILALTIGSSLAVARTAQQGPPPDPSQDQSGRPDGDGRGGPMGMRRSMMNDGRRGPDGDRGARGGEEAGRWGRGGMGMRGGMRMRGGMGMRGRGEGPREFGLTRLLSNPEIRQQIGVTADQAAKIRQQESDFRKTQIRNGADLQIKRMDLHDLLSAEKPDRAAINSKLEEISAAQLTMAKSAVDFHLTMRDALTPAQREKLEQWMKQRRQPGADNNAGPRGPRAGGPGGRGARGAPGGSTPPANGQRQTTPNQ
jgi:Spy/CpxP family protein refolding chaperone